MTRLMGLLHFVLVALLTVHAAALPKSFEHGLDHKLQSLKRNGNQSIVSWDDHSLFVRGERVHFYSGEYHPFRLPVPGLWLDVFQKIKALGYNGVSFYVDWALLEGEPGVIRDTGIFDLQPFFDAALQAGIYLLARPGPYINAEASGGGFPGWLQTIQGRLRTNESAYVDSTKLYLTSVLAAIAKGQITNGGPVILVQVENEYTQAISGILYPDYGYMLGLEQMFLDANIIVPLIDNDSGADGHFAPGTRSQVDIYGYDGYPLGFDCATPYTWGSNSLPTGYWNTHEQQDPSAPHFIVEFQGGSFDPWGGYGFAMCTELLGPEFERLFYKNNIASGVTMMNIYMTFGGTNWGNLGYPVGYTSYDYGAVIAEDRTVSRQKYSEAKLIANFVQVSPALLTAVPGALSTALYSTTQFIAVTPLVETEVTRNSGIPTKFYIARQATYNELVTVPYSLIAQTSKGTITIPQLGGNLSIIGRDSKIHVVDYALAGHHLLYSSAEVFTWGQGKPASKTVLVVYGEISEQHEMAIIGTPSVLVLEDSGVQMKVIHKTTVINWQVGPTRNVVKLGTNLFVYMLPRQQAYNWWSLPIAADNSKAPSSADNAPNLIVNGGYLLRNVTVSGKQMAIRGDINATTPLEVVLGAPQNLETLTFNGEAISFTQDVFGTLKATLDYADPVLNLPDLLDLTWKYYDSLPEIQPSYDDSAWTSADKNETANIDVTLATPTSLLSSDYGFNTGSLIFRGHFTASGNETTGTINVAGGEAFGYNLWLNSTLIGTWLGSGATASYSINFNLPTLITNAAYTLTLVQDFTGYEENYEAGDSPASPQMKSPRGILSYSLSGHAATDITWKITGNLGGQNYKDLTRGPLNEGAMYAERQGWHLPSPPTSDWSTSSPGTGISTAGIGFYATSFALDIPEGYDTPLSFVFSPTTSPSPHFRVQLYVNGYQFGKYVNHIGPQTVFPVPDGILNHRGENYVAITLWAQDTAGAKLGGFELQATAVVQSGYGSVVAAPQPAWTLRAGVY